MTMLYFFCLVGVWSGGILIISNIRSLDRERAINLEFAKFRAAIGKSW
jgi:hypothetical protein